jgi:hypothetical protein
MGTTKCRENRHFHDCECLSCQSKRAFCTCTQCIIRRTRWSGRFTDSRDFSRYPSLQQLVDLEE